MGQFEALTKLRASMQGNPDPGFVHFYPVYDPKEHVCGPRGTPCWCEPTLDHIDPRIVIHNQSH